jgi:hypothetical protein
MQSVQESTSPTMGSVQRGKRDLAIDNVCRIAWALGVEPVDLLVPPESTEVALFRSASPGPLCQPIRSDTDHPAVALWNQPQSGTSALPIYPHTVIDPPHPPRYRAPDLSRAQRVGECA